MKKVTRLLGILLLLFQIMLTANATMRVSPTLIEINANKTRNNFVTASFDVQSGDKETIRFKVYPEYFEITDKGRMDMLGQKESPYSLVKNVRVVPNEFTLTNGRPQKVRLTIANVRQLPDGESRVVLFMEDIKTREMSLPYSNKNVNAQVTVKTRIGIPIYVDKGNFVKTGNLNELKVESANKDLVYKIRVDSQGNSKIRYFGKAQIIKDKKLISEFPVNSHAVQAKKYVFDEGKIPLDKITENGTYTLRMILNYENEKGRSQNLIKDTTFTVDSINATSKI